MAIPGPPLMDEESAEQTETPEERPYGIDSGFRDRSGDSIRLTEVRLPATI